MKSDQTVKTKNLEAELVIIGGGLSGLAAAVAAAENGVKNVVLLEAQDEPGGNGLQVGVLFAAEGARRDTAFKAAMSYAHWKTNPRIIRTLVDRSGDTLHWLEDKGLKFIELPLPSPPNQAPRTVNFCGRPGTPSGVFVVEALKKSCEELGVQILCQTRAKNLLTDEKGSVSGVLAETKDGECKITAKSVIIATGGFRGNKELLEKYVPSFHGLEEFVCLGLSHNGDGLRMATEVGAATEGLAIVDMAAPVFLGTAPHLSSFVSRPNLIWVNKKGERFADETIGILMPEAGNAIWRQPDKTCYCLFDEKIKQGILRDGSSEFEEKMGLDTKSWRANVDEMFKSEAEKGAAKVSNSWDEIARWIGAAPEVLKNTIDEYNSCCDRGRDEFLAKDKPLLVPLRTPPYYALKCGIRFESTRGGIKINHRTEVLDNQDKPMPGLYAAGVETGGWEAETYNFYIPGHSFSFSISEGRIAAENAAKFIKSK